MGDITITEGSNLLWSGGSIEGSGSLIVENDARLYANASSSLDRYLVNNGSLLDFTDASQIAPWAQEAMSYLVSTGMVAGSGGKLNPAGTATRAEMAQVLFNLLANNK